MPSCLHLPPPGDTVSGSEYDGGLTRQQGAAATRPSTVRSEQGDLATEDIEALAILTELGKLGGNQKLHS